MGAPQKPRSLGLSPRTSFVGRAEEMRALSTRLRAGDRLITILGPPGAGKTRLADRFATVSWKGREVIGCSLAGARSLEDVARALASALDVPLGGESTSADVDRIGYALADRGACLVVLDNAEDVVALAPAAVGRWMDLAPSARWLCTSRQLLAIAGESCFALGGLPPPQARALFLERARLIAGPKEPGEGESAIIDELVARLDHLPLAIELAASRAGVLSPKQLLQALARRFDLLTSRGADVIPRHATMRTAIDVSWEFLGPIHQEALARASVFRGPFSLAAARAVLDQDEPSAIATLEALRERSLLRVVQADEGGDEGGGGDGDEAGEVRFALYESIREYAASRPEIPIEDAEERHARYYASEGARHAAAAVTGARPSLAARALSRDLAELLAAHRRMRERRPALALAAVLAAEVWLSFRGSLETHRELLDDAVALARGLGDARLLSKTLSARAKMLAMRGLYPESKADFEAALAAAIASGDKTVEVLALYGMSACYRESAMDIGKALAFAEEGLETARAAGDAGLEAWCLGSVAAAATAAGDVDVAIERHEQAIKLLSRMGQVRPLALNFANLGLALEAKGFVEEARRANQEALELVEQVGDEVLRGKILWGLTRLEFDLGHAAEAEAQLALMEQLARRTGDREVAAQVVTERARRALVSGDRERGLAFVAKARAMIGALDSPRLVRELESVRALAGGAGPALRADLSGSWFERAGVGRVDLSKRRALRLVLARLVEARRAGQVLSVEDLLAAGWPGESVLPESGAMRVWTAIRTLRRMGLAGILQSREGGYALDPAVPLDAG